MVIMVQYLDSLLGLNHQLVVKKMEIRAFHRAFKVDAGLHLSEASLFVLFITILT
jgi:hypothetical protein